MLSTSQGTPGTDLSIWRSALISPCLRWRSSLAEFQVINLSNTINTVVFLKHPMTSSRYVGYCGYIPGVKAENVFGESYGKSSSQSSKGQIIRGFDQGPQDKFKSVAQASFQNQKELQQRLRAAANSSTMSQT